MTNARNIESALTDLEGAQNALLTLARSSEITPEGVVGLEWISRQIYALLGDLRENWDAANPEKKETPPLKAVEDGEARS